MSLQFEGSRHDRYSIDGGPVYPSPWRLPHAQRRIVLRHLHCRDHLRLKLIAPENGSHAVIGTASQTSIEVGRWSKCGLQVRHRRESGSSASSNRTMFRPSRQLATRDLTTGRVCRLRWTLTGPLDVAQDRGPWVSNLPSRVVQTGRSLHGERGNRTEHLCHIRQRSVSSFPPTAAVRCSGEPSRAWSLNSSSNWRSLSSRTAPMIRCRIWRTPIRECASFAWITGVFLRPATQAYWRVPPTSSPSWMRTTSPCRGGSSSSTRHL